MNWLFWIGAKHSRVIWSVVRVPVLSKQTVSIDPPSTTFYGDMQWIFFAFRLAKETRTPILSAAGKDGGIVTVIRSKSLSKIAFPGRSS